jgi:two-component system cell cycle sensor histidine kinase/response regulator CckA
VISDEQGDANLTDSETPASEPLAEIEILRRRVAELTSLAEEREQLLGIAERRAHLLDQILSASPDRIFLLGPSGERLCASTGSPELPRHITDEMEAGLEAVLLTGQPSAEEVSVQLAGEYRHYELTLSPAHGSDGAVEAVLVTVRDITAHKRAEGALAETAEGYRVLAENASDIIWTMTLDGQPVYVSPSVTRLTGYTVDEAMDVRLERQLTPSSYAMAMKALSTELKVGPPSPGNPPRSRTLQLELVRKDGTTFWAEAHVSFAYDSDGQPVRVVGVTRDISERKHLEEQLLRVQKMETIGRLAGGVAHDFNNLLTAIIGHASYARDALHPQDPAREDIEQALKAANRAGALTRQLLAFSRTQTIAPRVLNLNDLIIDLERLLRRLVGEDVELALIPAPSLGLVRADPGQLEQALVNLAANARDAMPAGGNLTLETANIILQDDSDPAHIGASPGEYVMLVATDTGIGMTDEVKAHLFEPFFTTKEPGRGTGLGLATVFGIVKQHQGHISVHSEPGQGATFRIYLPRIRDQHLEWPARDERLGLASGSETVLIAEDEEAVRSLAARTLRELGYTVLEAADGEEALQAARSAGDTIHLLLTDVIMPHVGGAALAAQIAETHTAIKTLFISGYTPGTAGQELPAGAAFLQKPFSIQDLARRVREVLDS